MLKEGSWRTSGRLEELDQDFTTSEGRRGRKLFAIIRLTQDQRVI
jgi:hypothetical protein